MNIVFVMSIAFFFGAFVSHYMGRNEIKEKTILANKHLEIVKMFSCWINIRQKGRTLVEYFENNKYHKVAIYGMSYLGKALADELEHSTVRVMYGIDKNAVNKCADFEMVLPDESFEEVDAIVVTTLTDFEIIKKMIIGKTHSRVVSLKEVLDYYE